MSRVVLCAFILMSILSAVNGSVGEGEGLGIMDIGQEVTFTSTLSDGELSEDIQDKQGSQSSSPGMDVPLPEEWKDEDLMSWVHGHRWLLKSEEKPVEIAVVIRAVERDLKMDRNDVDDVKAKANEHDLTAPQGGEELSSSSIDGNETVAVKLGDLVNEKECYHDSMIIALFSATSWDHNSVLMEPYFNALPGAFANSPVRFVKVDASDSPESMRNMRVRSLPMIFALDPGSGEVMQKYGGVGDWTRLLLWTSKATKAKYDTDLEAHPPALPPYHPDSTVVIPMPPPDMILWLCLSWLGFVLLYVIWSAFFSATG